MKLDADRAANMGCGIGCLALILGLILWVVFGYFQASISIVVVALILAGLFALFVHWSQIELRTSSHATTTQLTSLRATYEAEFGTTKTGKKFLAGVPSDFAGTITGTRAALGGYGLEMIALGAVSDFVASILRDMTRAEKPPRQVALEDQIASLLNSLRRYEKAHENRTFLAFGLLGCAIFFYYMTQHSAK